MTKINAPERVPDWLLGGQVRRRILEGLLHPQGRRAAKLASEINAGEATVYEVIRALHAIGAAEKIDRGCYRLAEDQPVARALRSLIAASSAFANVPVSRPPGRVRRQ